MPESWPKEASHQDAWGDPAGDTKVEYSSPEGRTRGAQAQDGARCRQRHSRPI